VASRIGTPEVLERRTGHRRDAQAGDSGEREYQNGADVPLPGEDSADSSKNEHEVGERSQRQKLGSIAMSAWVSDIVADVAVVAVVAVIAAAEHRGDEEAAADQQREEVEGKHALRRCSRIGIRASTIERSHIQIMAKRFWTVANAIMLLMFLFSAVVQFNDPDPIVWIAIYGAAAAVCGFEIRRPTPMWVPVAVALVAVGWAGTLYFRAHDVPISSLFAQWEMRDIRVEEAREMYGLAIVGVWMIVIVTVRTMRARIRDHSGLSG
jgi:hypothetical protein